MIPDLDLLRATQLLVSRHGVDAALLAAQRTDELLDQAGLEGAAIWKSLTRAVEKLLSVVPNAGEKPN
jgi:hypothetical protein